MKKNESIKIDLKYLDKLIRYSQDVLAVFNEQGKELFVSPSVEKTLGYSPEEMIRSSGWHLIHPDDLPSLKASFNKLKKEPGSTIYNQHRMLHKNGSWVHVEAVGVNLLHDPVINGFVVTIHDLTRWHKIEKVQMDALQKVKESEQRYRALFNSNLDGIVKADLEGNLIEANRAFYKMLGLRYPGRLPGNYRDITPQQWHVIDELINVRQVFERGYSDVFEKEYIRKDGSTVPVNLTVYLIKDNGKPVGMWGVVRDLSEQKRNEKRLAMAFDKLESMNRHLIEVREQERRAIAADIHDEIGQSMTALHLELGWLADKTDDKECLDKINQLMKIASEATRHTQRISGELRPSMLDDLGLIPAIEWYCGDFEKRTAVKCHLNLQKCFINKDVELALFRIVQEALTNVTRHAQATNVNIQLECTKESLRMTVEDNGIGIPEEKIDHYQSFGLMGMHERARMCKGDLRISTNNGTRIEVEIAFFE